MDDELKDKIRRYLSQGRTAKFISSVTGVPVADIEDMAMDGVRELDNLDAESLGELLDNLDAPKAALLSLMDVAKNGSSEAARVAAAKTIAEMKWGKAVQTSKLDGVTTINIIGSNIMPPASLVRRDDKDVIDAEYTEH